MRGAGHVQQAAEPRLRCQSFPLAKVQHCVPRNSEHVLDGGHVLLAQFTGVGLGIVHGNAQLCADMGSQKRHTGP